MQEARSRGTSCGAPSAVGAGRTALSFLPAVSRALLPPVGALALLAPLATGVVFVPAGVAAQQERYSSGQTLSPAYEGWERNGDGSFNLVFGYLNRNWEQTPHVPVGPDNRFEPGDPDRGQPTYFLPRRNRFVFRVRVPADFGDQELVWTVTVNGVTEKAYGTLKRDYYIDKLVVQANFGAGGAAGTTPELPDNESPTLEVEGAAERTVRAGEPLSLAAVSTDDGKPRARPLRYGVRSGLPRPITTDSATGHRLSWFVYRGPGAGVMFDPPQIKVWEDTRDNENSPWSLGFRTPDPPEDGRWAAEATFSEPGNYVLRAIAHDGGLETTADVAVTVTP